MTTIGGFDVLSDHVCPGTDPRLKIFANWKLPQCVAPPTPDPHASRQLPSDADIRADEGRRR